MWSYVDKTTVYLPLVVQGLIKVIINTGLILRENMLRNKKHTRNETKANQHSKGVVLVQAALIEDLKIKGAFQG
ncbi:MAG: hypothetical protein ACOYB0_01405 [Polynucleobacter sp.]